MDKYFKANIPKGTHLANSKKEKGKMVGALLDNKTNQVVGQAKFIEVDHPKRNKDNPRIDKETLDHFDQSMSFLSDSVSSAVSSLVSLATISRISKSMGQDLDSLSPEQYRIKKEIEMQKEIEFERLRIEEARREARRERLFEILLSIIKVLGKGLWFILKHLGIGIWIALKYIGIGTWNALKGLGHGIYKLSIQLFHFTSRTSKKIHNKPQKVAIIKPGNYETHEIKVPFKINSDNKLRVTEPSKMTSIGKTEFCQLVDQIYDNYSAYTIEADKQIHLINIFLLSFQLANEIRALYSTSDETLANSKDYQEWQNAMRRMASFHIVNLVNNILEKNNDLLPQNKMDDIIRLFQAGKFENGIYIPIAQEKVEELLLR